MKPHVKERLRRIAYSKLSYHSKKVWYAYLTYEELQLLLKDGFRIHFEWNKQYMKQVQDHIIERKEKGDSEPSYYYLDAPKGFCVRMKELMQHDKR